MVFADTISVIKVSFAIKGFFIMAINDKPIVLTNSKAVRLVKQKAIAENRSFTNALLHTVLTALGDSKPKSGGLPSLDQLPWKPDDKNSGAG